MIKPQTTNHKPQTNSNTEITNYKTNIFWLFGIWFFGIVCNLCIVYCNFTFAYAQEKKDAKELTRCVCEGKISQSVCLDELKGSYFKDNKYTELVDILKSACPDNKEMGPTINYYIALARYSQLKYLEDAKSWDEYFAKGNDYRDDIVSYAQKSIDATTSKDASNIGSKLLLFQFHKDQQDPLSDSSLAELSNSLFEYAQSGSDIKIIKEAADSLLIYNERGKAKELYKIYASKLAGSNIKDDELRNIAASFYKESNLELAENIYDIYIERVSKAKNKEKAIPELISIAKQFSYSPVLEKERSQIDAHYAEKVFKKIEEVGGKKAFDEGLMYWRGFNLEKAKAFSGAKDVYVEFLKTFPKSAHAEEVTYKTGIIFIYVLRDINSGRVYLEQLAAKEGITPYALSSLYQLGLLKQWEGDLAAAKDYYNLLSTKIGNSDPEGLAIIQGRLNEINQNKPLEYNLKIGLDTALKEEFVNLDMTKFSLESSSYLPEKGKEVKFLATASLGPTGCLQVELQYLWSGDLGLANPSISQSEFQASYKTAGTKFIYMVLVSPEGIADRGINLVDVR